MNPLLDELNPAQRQAVEAPDGPVMIIAGPGTGKTKTLVARIAWLLHTGRAAPAEILALAFTAKAAAQMRERLATQVTTHHQSVPIGTFHALALDALGPDSRKFISETERREIIRTLPRPSALKNLTARELILKLSRYKNATHHPDTALQEFTQTYNRQLEARHQRDFDDILIAWQHHLAQQTAPAPWRYVLVDEFQDTSPVQYDIVRRLGQQAHLFIIGDPWQSIYGFRGASGHVFEQFAADFPRHTLIKLETNYRSAPAIVRLANHAARGENPLVAHHTHRGQTRIIETLTPDSEATLVLNEIEQLLGGTDLARVDSTEREGQYQFQDIAVIYRTHRAALALTRKLSSSGLPYQVVGGEGPYDRPAVRLVMAVIQALDTPRASSLTPELQYLTQLAPPQLPPSQLVHWVAERLNIQTDDDRLAITSLAATLMQFDPLADGRNQAAHYLTDLETNEFYDPAAQAITLLTIHAAKGLEFPVVFVLNTCEGGLPHLRADGQHDLEEERRLFYVAVTRARDHLTILHPRQQGGQVVKPSRFLDGLPTERLIDPTMTQLIRKQTRGQAKRAQDSLF